MPGKPKFKPGQKYGCFTIIKDTGRRYQNGDVIWLVQCTCGNYEERSSVVLNRKYGYYKGQKVPITPKCRKCFSEKMHAYDLGGTYADDENRKKKAYEAQGFHEGTALSQISNDRKMNSNNTTGHRGINRTPDGHYRVRLTIKRIEVLDRNVSTLEEAIKLRQEAEERYYAPIIEKYTEEEK